MIRLKFKNPLHYIAFATLVFGLSFASLILLGDIFDKVKLNFHDVLRFYIMSIIGGLVFSVLSLPFYLIGLKEEEPVSDYKGKDRKLKQIVFSNYFFIIVFCSLSSLRIVFSTILKEALMASDMVLSIFCALVVGFCFPGFIVLGGRLWKNISIHHKEAEMEQPVSPQKRIFFYAYYAGLLGCVYMGIGWGTFGFIFTRYICTLSYDTFGLALDIYAKTLPLGICCGNICYFYGEYKRLNYKKK
jgi:hypothetical protein